MTGKQRLNPAVFDNHVLRLWRDWAALTAQNPALKNEWRYERDEKGCRLAGPAESLTRTVGNAALIVFLGGDGRYTPRAEMIDRHGAQLAGPGRVKTCISPPRTDGLFAAMAYAEEAAYEVGKPDPARRRGRKRLEGRGG